MKKLFIIILMFMPLLASAQDNTWEKIEVEEQPKDNPDAKYLAPNAVPEVDGKVCWQTTIKAKGKSAKQIYDILFAQVTKMLKEPNQLETSMMITEDPKNHEFAAIFHEWLVFKSNAFSLDQTQFNFGLHVKASDGQAVVTIDHVSYDYEPERNPQHYEAEEWITDKYAVNKKHTKLYPISSKFRRKTIDRKDYIFNKFNSLLNEK